MSTWPYRRSAFSVCRRPSSGSAVQTFVATWTWSRLPLRAPASPCSARPYMGELSNRLTPAAMAVSTSGVRSSLVSNVRHVPTPITGTGSPGRPSGRRSTIAAGHLNGTVLLLRGGLCFEDDRRIGGRPCEPCPGRPDLREVSDFQPGAGNLTQDVFDVHLPQRVSWHEDGHTSQPCCQHAWEPAPIEPLLIRFLDGLHVSTVGQPSRTVVLLQGPKPGLEKQCELGGVGPALPLDEHGSGTRIPSQDRHTWALELDALVLRHAVRVDPIAHQERRGLPRCASAPAAMRSKVRAASFVGYLRFPRLTPNRTYGRMSGCTANVVIS